MQDSTPPAEAPSVRPNADSRQDSLGRRPAAVPERRDLSFLAGQSASDGGGSRSFVAEETGPEEPMSSLYKAFVLFVSWFIAVPILPFLTIIAGICWVEREKRFTVSGCIYLSLFCLLVAGVAGLLLLGRPDPGAPSVRIPRFGVGIRLMAFLLTILAAFPLAALLH